MSVCESSGCITVDDFDGHVRVHSGETGTVLQCTIAEWQGFLADLADGKWAHIGVVRVGEPDG